MDTFVTVLGSSVIQMLQPIGQCVGLSTNKRAKNKKASNSTSPPRRVRLRCYATHAPHCADYAPHVRGVIFPELWGAPLCGGRSCGIAQYRTRWGGVASTACACYNAQLIKCIASARPPALWSHLGGWGAVAMRWKDTDTVRAVAGGAMFKIPTVTAFLGLALLLLTLYHPFDSPTHCPMGHGTNRPQLHGR